MGKKKGTGGPDEGTRIRVKHGVVSPDFPDVSFAGWTGRIAEVSGKAPAPLKFIVEWDSQTIAAMPADYVSRCEAQMLFHAMACLSEADLEFVV